MPVYFEHIELYPMILVSRKQYKGSEIEDSHAIAWENSLWYLHKLAVYEARAYLLWYIVGKEPYTWDRCTLLGKKCHKHLNFSVSSILALERKTINLNT